MGHIAALGDVNLTTKFTQEGSSAGYGNQSYSIISNTIIAKNLTVNHSANTDIVDGIVKINGHLNLTGNLNVNTSGYKELKLHSEKTTLPPHTIEQMNIAGSVNINTVASVAASTTKFGSILGTKGGVKINVSAANGIADAVFAPREVVAEEKGIDVTLTNLKTVNFYDDVNTYRGLVANGATASTKGDINFTATTNVSDSLIKIGYLQNIGGNVALKAHGQKNLEVGHAGATDLVKSKDGNVNIDISANNLNAEARFWGGILSENKDVTIKANGFKKLTLTSYFEPGMGWQHSEIHADKGHLSINTGTNSYLQRLEIGQLFAKTIDLDFSNVLEAVNSHLDPVVYGTPDKDKLLIDSQDNLNFKGYAGAQVTQMAQYIKDLDTTASNEAKDFVANIINARGGIGGDNRPGSLNNNFTETITLKGGITNPDSILSAGNETGMLIRLNKMIKIKSVDASEYNNASGVTSIDTYTENALLTTIKGSITKDNITVNSANLKLVDSGKGDDKVTFTITQTNDITVNLGAGNDTITTAALTANKKFEISGGAGNDKFKLAASTTTDNTASKYVTITDASRGDKIGLSNSVTGFVKTNANATSGQTDLKDAINAALASQGTTTANNIYAVYYGNETYLVRDADASKTLSAGDNLVKLAGLSNYDVLNGNVITDTDGVTKLLEITNS